MARTSSAYDVHPSIAYLQAIVDNLPAKTGRSIDEWGNDGPDTNPKAYLAAAPGYVEAMYDGGKAALRPIHETLVALGRSLGRDVKVCPCETIIPLYRNHVFAQVKPSTRTRIDFGLALKGAKGKLPKRLIDTGGIAKGDRITHRIEVTSLAGIDAELKKWLAVAYDLDAVKGERRR